MLFLCGTVVPIDPRTQAVVGPPWYADGNQFSPDRSYTPAMFPIQGGYGLTTDAILRTSPPVLSGYFKVNETRGQWNPLPSFRGRAQQLRSQFEAIEGRLGPVRLWVNGFPPLKNYGMQNVSMQRQGNTTLWHINVTFIKLTYTTLLVVPPGVDPELLQLGVIAV